jgi:sulfate transport system ATP-binding protein
MLPERPAGAAGPAAIRVQHVTKRFGAFTALDQLSLDVERGELLALLGPSGSGKTTLLRVIAGLEAPDAGAIHFDGEDATDRHARDRRVGFVFQHYALFRHMSVFENVAFGLRVQPRRVRPPEREIRRRVRELLDLVQLGPLETRHPAELSGGQRQRVGLARALAVQPKVLLLDEPFGALDAQVRKELRRWLRRLHDEIRVTSVFVTHDQDEALEVADRVVVMQHGRIEQVGTPEEVYERPATPFVYAFLGSVNLFHARLDNGRVHIGSMHQEAPEYAAAENEAAVAFVRTHEVEIATSPNGSTFEAVVRHARALGASVRVELESPEYTEPIEAELSRERFDELKLRRGDRVFVKPGRLRVFVADRNREAPVPDPDWVL